MDASHHRFTLTDLERLESETFVAAIDFHESLGSTSDRAIELCRAAELTTPLLVLANEQTAGRGRGANRWWAASGAITFSLVIDAAEMGLRLDALPQVSLATGIALCEALSAREPQLDFRLKWPNDLFASGPYGQPRKLAGILLERPPGAAPRLVIGIGVNVNNSHAEAPEDIRQRATSLCDLSSRQHELCDVLIDILKHLESLLGLLATGTIDLPELWHPHCLLRGRDIEALSGNRTVTGRCHGIDAEGALLVNQAGTMQRLFSATIERW